jgi:hypothetical protein
VPGWQRHLSGFFGVAVVALLLSPNMLWAQQDSTRAQRDSAVSVSLGGFVDSYFAFVTGDPDARDVFFLTQPGRDQEFNINLVFVDARLSGPRLRGRVAFQAGTSVQINYAAEPVFGFASGPLLARHIQEAFAGYRVAKDLWIDAGIYFSHIGSESWISRDNWTYTRSLIAEWSPYYETGVKATWTPSPKFSGLLTMVNGWQIISDNNDNKGFGVRLDYSPTSSITLSYSNFLGNELPDTLLSATRFFNDVSAKVLFGDRAGLMGTFDWGTQDDLDWYGYSLIGRVKVADHIAVVGRVERYSDPDQVLIVTGLDDGFVSNGLSIGVDIAGPAPFAGIGPASRFLWRTEFRALPAEEAFFPFSAFRDRDVQNFLVSSFALTF